MMAPVRKRAMQHMLWFGNDVLIKIAYIFGLLYIKLYRWILSEEKAMTTFTN